MPTPITPEQTETPVESDTQTTPTESPKGLEYYLQKHEEKQAEPTYDSLTANDLGIEQLPEGQSSYKGMSPVGQVLKISPPEMRKHWSNIQSVVSKKDNRIQELESIVSQLQSKLDSHPKELHDQVTSLRNQIKPVEEIDTTTDEGYRELARNEALQAILGVYEPQFKKHSLEEAQSKQLAFVDSHPEFQEEEFFGAVLDIMEGKGYPIEDAFIIAKSVYKPREVIQQEFQQEVQKANQSVRSKETAMGTLGGIRPSAVKPDFSKAKSAWEMAKLIDPTLRD